MKIKDVYAQFNGPWEKEEHLIVAGDKILTSAEIVNRFNELLSMMAKMVMVLEKSNPAKFREFWYDNTK